MIYKIILTFTVLIFASVSQTYAQKSTGAIISNYDGSYFLLNSKPKPFAHFQYIDIVSSSNRSSSVVYSGDVNLFSREADSSIICPMQYIRLINDSLTFKSSNCVGETYEFSGKWLLSPDKFVTEERVSVLEGIMKYSANGRLVKKEKVSFYYVSGC